MHSDILNRTGSTRSKSTGHRTASTMATAGKAGPGTELKNRGPSTEYRGTNHKSMSKLVIINC